MTWKDILSFDDKAKEIVESSGNQKERRKNLIEALNEKSDRLTYSERKHGKTNFDAKYRARLKFDIKRLKQQLEKLQ